MMEQLNLDPEHVIDALRNQRNSAMDEIARQAAIIRALQLQLKDKPAQSVIPFPHASD